MDPLERKDNELLQRLRIALSLEPNVESKHNEEDAEKFDLVNITHDELHNQLQQEIAALEGGKTPEDRNLRCSTVLRLTGEMSQFSSSALEIQIKAHGVVLKEHSARFEQQDANIQLLMEYNNNYKKAHMIHQVVRETENFIMSQIGGENCVSSKHIFRRTLPQAFKAYRYLKRVPGAKIPNTLMTETEGIKFENVLKRMYPELSAHDAARDLADCASVNSGGFFTVFPCLKIREVNEAISVVEYGKIALERMVKLLVDERIIQAD